MGHPDPDPNPYLKNRIRGSGSGFGKKRTGSATLVLTFVISVADISFYMQIKSLISLSISKRKFDLLLVQVSRSAGQLVSWSAGQLVSRSAGQLVSCRGSATTVVAKIYTGILP